MVNIDSGIILGLILTYILNIPFGYWRAYAKKKGRKAEWLLAIHAPVPLIVAIRLLVGAGWSEVPLFVVAFFLGQFTGGRLHVMLSRMVEASRCLPCDIARVSRGR